MENISVEKFRKLNKDTDISEKLARPSTTYWKDAWRRLKENKIAILAIIVLLVIGIMTIIGPHINGYSFEEYDSAKVNLKPSAEHWFGTDNLGRDIFSRVWQGGRVSIVIGIFGALISTVVGCIYGAVSAYFGGKVDNIMMRIVEILASIPYLIVVILLSIIFTTKVSQHLYL